MKTERRHELQTNVLADSLAHWIEAAKPYSRAALAVVIALVGAIFAWGYYSSQSSRQQADGWTEYYDAMMSRDPREGLSDVVARYAGTSVAQWARVVLADLQLDDGTNRMFVDKAAGREELQKTIEAYQAILAESDQQNLLERATFGMARAREALGKELVKAREDYRSIATKWPNSPFAAPAEARAKDLDRLETKDFYDWFAKYEPPRPMSKEPGIPGVRPEFMKDPLEDAGLKLPSLLDDKSSLLNPAAEAPADATTEPAGEEKPAGEQPAEPEAAASESAPKEPASGEPAPVPK
jgi:hypothetical protein